jgi:hypothetical protein
MSGKASTCFIIMPVSMPNEALELYTRDIDHFTHVLEHLFTPAIEKIGYTAIPPIAAGADIIHAEIIRNLETSDLVLCDMSTLNPNVFFELGIRTAVDKPIALVKDKFTHKVPFDTTLINHHIYDAALTPWTLTNEIQRLSEHLLKTINNSGARNTLWKYFGLSTRAELPAPSSVEDKLNFIIQAMERTHDKNIVQPQITTGDPLIIEKEVINAAQKIASKVSAEFTVIDIAPGKVVLDLGVYALTDSEWMQIQRLSKRRKVEIDIHGGVGR